MKEVIIIGGGIGGAATALALIRAGLEPVVYERTKELREVGAGIALWANATHILKNLYQLAKIMLQIDPPNPLIKGGTRIICVANI